MNIYRWALVIIAIIVGIGNIWLLDFKDLSLYNNAYEYAGIISMIGITYFLAVNSPQKNEDKESVS